MISQTATGQFFMFGFSGSEPSSDFLDFINEEQVGGVILFADNCADLKLTRNFIEKLQGRNQSDSGMLISIDQEGGRVCRLTGNDGEYHAAADYGARGDQASFIADYARSARFMKKLGINLNLAPVADLDLNPDNDCMAGRCFSARPEQAAAFVAESVRVAHQQNLLCCLKHFPGLGEASIDPHKETSEAAYDETTWRQREAVPFEAGIRAGADLVMTTHLQLPTVDDKIATGSKKIIGDWLRLELGFEGVVITDCLLMHGAAALGTPGERTVAAFKAGHDLLLFGQDFETARLAYSDFKRAVRDGEIDLHRLEEAAARLSLVRARIGGEFSV